MERKAADHTKLANVLGLVARVSRESTSQSLSGYRPCFRSPPGAVVCFSGMKRVARKAEQKESQYCSDEHTDVLDGFTHRETVRDVFVAP